MNEEFGQFLSEQSQVGRTVEQSLEFSVNLVAAQAKLGRYALPRESAWILKFVQAATAAGCPELLIFLTRERVELKFPVATFSPLSTLQANLDHLNPANLAEDHLFGGLLALKALPGQAYVEQSHQRWKPAEPLEPVPTDYGGQQLRVVYFPKSKSFWYTLRHRLRFTLELQRELQEFCYACPVRLMVDGQLLQFGVSDLPLVSGLIKGESGSHLDLYGQLTTDTGQRTRTYCSWGSNRPSHTAFAVQIRLLDKHRGNTLSVEWIRSGVVVQKEQLEISGKLSLQARILIPTRGLSFDVTGFSIQESSEATERQRKASLYLLEAVEALKGDLRRSSRWHRFLNTHHPDRAPIDTQALIEQLEHSFQAGRYHL